MQPRKFNTMKKASCNLHENFPIHDTGMAHLQRKKEDREEREKQEGGDKEAQVRRGRRCFREEMRKGEVSCM